MTAIRLVVTHPGTISSSDLAKNLEITQKAAWMLLQRLRQAIGVDRKHPFSEPEKMAILALVLPN
jgi:predicted ArsR family transcriptional regulator